MSGATIHWGRALDSIWHEDVECSIKSGHEDDVSLMIFFGEGSQKRLGSNHGVIDVEQKDQ